MYESCDREPSYTTHIFFSKVRFAKVSSRMDFKEFPERFLQGDTTALLTVLEIPDSHKPR